eukprot:SAG31_NODE_1230_length_9212_cov_3.669264_8_plen_117_part_00
MPSGAGAGGGIDHGGWVHQLAWVGRVASRVDPRPACARRDPSMLLLPGVAPHHNADRAAGTGNDCDRRRQLGVDDDLQLPRPDNLSSLAPPLPGGPAPPIGAGVEAERWRVRLDGG